MLSVVSVAEAKDTCVERNVPKPPRIKPKTVGSVLRFYHYWGLKDPNDAAHGSAHRFSETMCGRMASMVPCFAELSDTRYPCHEFKWVTGGSAYKPCMGTE